MARHERLRFKPGDLVFARFHGEEEFEIIEEVMGDLIFPHFKCKTRGGRRNDYQVFPQIHLSSKSIRSLIQEANYKQLELI